MKSNSGSTLILTLLVAATATIIGVAMSSRVVSNLRQSTYTSNADKAKKFADAGIEDTLAKTDAQLDGMVGTCTELSPCTLNVDGTGAANDASVWVTRVGSSDTVKTILEKDQTVQIDITGYTQGGVIELYWVNTGSKEDSRPPNGTGIDTEAALVVGMITETGGIAQVNKYTFDYNGASRPSGPNNFATPTIVDATIGGTQYKYRATVTVPAGSTARYLRIRPMYNSTQNSLAVKSTVAGYNFPNQGYDITSKGTSGESIWKAKVTKLNPALPSIFDYAIFTEGDLIK